MGQIRIKYIDSDSLSRLKGVFVKQHQTLASLLIGSVLYGNTMPSQAPEQVAM